MSALELKLEDWDVHETYTKDYSDALGDPAQNADYKWAGTTDFRGVDVFKSLNEFLQPNSDVSLETAAESILKLLPEAPYSNEVAEFGRIVIELARQIPYHHPAHVKLAALMEEVTMSTKLMKPDGVSIHREWNDHLTMANATCSTTSAELSDSRSRCAMPIMVRCLSPPPAHISHHHCSPCT